MLHIVASLAFDNDMIEYNQIINKFYEPGSQLHEVLMVHSRQVAMLASEICNRLANRGVEIDSQFVVEAAMLHDIGIVKVDAPGIHCHGTEPYIRHGIMGSEMLRELGLERHALVCERHTGAGITVEDIDAQQLPLPRRDYTPQSIEEKVVCYADKFFSKTHLGEPARDIEHVRLQMARFGADSVARFDEMRLLFE